MAHPRVSRTRVVTRGHADCLRRAPGRAVREARPRTGIRMRVVRPTRGLMSSASTPPSDAHDDVFIGDSEMARLMRAHDWAATPLGPVSGWAQSLKVALGLLLTSRFEMWLGWGDDIAFFYNDAYRPTLGGKHPRALATPTRLVYPEIWDDIKGRMRSVYDEGASTWDRALLLLINRRGFPEETYHTFSYSPLRGDGGRVEGIFCAVSEETERVISERRLESLSALATNLA